MNQNTGFQSRQLREEHAKINEPRNGVYFLCTLRHASRSGVEGGALRIRWIAFALQHLHAAAQLLFFFTRQLDGGGGYVLMGAGGGGGAGE